MIFFSLDHYIFFLMILELKLLMLPAVLLGSYGFLVAGMFCSICVVSLVMSASQHT